MHDDVWVTYVVAMALKKVNKDEIDQISRKQISGLQDIGISQPKWPADAYGVIVLIIVFCVFEKESNERV